MPGVTPQEALGFRWAYDSGESMMQIARRFNRGVETVWRHLHKSGATRSADEGWGMAKCEGRVPDPPSSRKWSCDEGMFERGLSADASWLLGLIYGDGHINRERGRLLLACGIDRDLADKSKAILGYDGPIRQRNNCWMVELISRPLVDSLCVFGLTGGSKTYTMTFPDIPRELLPHFLRGCWEADGTFSRLKRGDLFVKYTSASLGFVRSMNSILSSEVGVSEASIQKPSGSKGDVSRSISWAGSSSDLIAHWMYESSSLSNRSDRKFAVWKGGQ